MRMTMNDSLNANQPPVWECEHEVVVNARPEIIWRQFQDVAAWPQWNAGISHIEMSGPFETGNHFVMTTPGQEPFTTRLVEVRENNGFLDETRVGELRIFVDHQIQPISEDLTRVVYSLQAFGPGCDDVGPMVSADFPDVLKSLAARAESVACEPV